jgi:hypothetical protein
MKRLLVTALFLTVVGESRDGYSMHRNIPWLSLAPEVGYVFFKGNELEKTYHAEAPNRHGVVLKGHVDVGGTGGALEVAPLYTFQHAGGLLGNLHGVGGEVSLVYRHSAGEFHPGIGLGFHGVFYAPNDDIQRGMDLMARIPIGTTWYFARYLGLVLETGPMLGVTGILFKDTDDPVQSALFERMELAFVFGIDLVMGLRFP